MAGRKLCFSWCIYMSVFSDKSESKLLKNKVSTACFQGCCAMEDGKVPQQRYLLCHRSWDNKPAESIKWNKSVSTDLLAKLEVGRGVWIIGIKPCEKMRTCLPLAWNFAFADKCPKVKTEFFSCLLPIQLTCHFPFESSWKQRSVTVMSS